MIFSKAIRVPARFHEGIQGTWTLFVKVPGYPDALFQGIRVPGRSLPRPSGYPNVFHQESQVPRRFSSMHPGTRMLFFKAFRYLDALCHGYSDTRKLFDRYPDTWTLLAKVPGYPDALYQHIRVPG